MNSINKFVKTNPRDAKLIMAHLYVAVIALLVGGLMGLLQVLVRTGKVTLPSFIGYYEILTVHGVVLALVLTTFFIIGFQFAAVSRSVGELSDKVRRAGWIGFWLMTVGTVMAAVMILIKQATVLYTFYAPLTAHPIFYIGLVLVVVGSWIAGGAQLVSFFKWKKQNKGKVSPLLLFMVAINNLLWFGATIGVAVESLVQLIPLSMGWVDGINVLVSRTLFWYFGHPLVYFWLLPAYMCWYVIIPKVIGGKIFSDSLARLSFVLFLLFSIPVGFHHQLMEPGIDPSWKFLQVVLTMLVSIPSLLTAFSLFATFESTGRKKGSRGLFGWLKKMPWKDARFTVPFIGMVAFIPAGAGGIVNASNQLNAIVHNTLWVTGHFHLTLATAVILTYFGVMYWLIPHLTGRVLTAKMNKLAIIQACFWAVGMTLMSTSMHLQGLFAGGPRRSSFSEYSGIGTASDFLPYQLAQAVGGSILFIGVLLAVYIFVNLAFFAPKGEQEFPVGEVATEAEKTPLIFDNFKLWGAVAVVLIVIAYTIPLINMLQNSPPDSPPFKLW